MSKRFSGCLRKQSRFPGQESVKFIKLQLAAPSSLANELDFPALASSVQPAVCLSVGPSVVALFLVLSFPSLFLTAWSPHEKCALYLSILYWIGFENGAEQRRRKEKKRRKWDNTKRDFTLFLARKFTASLWVAQTCSSSSIHWC